MHKIEANEDIDLEMMVKRLTKENKDLKDKLTEVMSNEDERAKASFRALDELEFK